jgi:CheY-like chemotaxis protein
MPAGGQLSIRATSADLSVEEARTNPDAEPGRYVMLQVADTGSGIPPEVLDKVFEPFFTTKPSGKGTGLGLSTVYSIVKSHGGFVEVESSEGDGTTFSVFVPAAEPNEIQVFGEETRESNRGHGETILLVDDEVFILDTASETLEESGYSVLTASDGRRAVDLFRDRGTGIDLIVTDLMMPDVDGFQTIREIRKLDKRVPIIAASGMAIDKRQDAIDVGANLFVAKPFTAEKLLSAIQDLLIQSSAAA